MVRYEKNGERGMGMGDSLNRKRVFAEIFGDDYCSLTEGGMISSDYFMKDVKKSFTMNKNLLDVHKELNKINAELLCLKKDISIPSLSFASKQALIDKRDELISKYKEHEELLESITVLHKNATNNT